MGIIVLIAISESTIEIPFFNHFSFFRGIVRFGLYHRELFRIASSSRIASLSHYCLRIAISKTCSMSFLLCVLESLAHRQRNILLQNLKEIWSIHRNRLSQLSLRVLSEYCGTSQPHGKFYLPVFPVFIL